MGGRTERSRSSSLLQYTFLNMVDGQKCAAQYGKAGGQGQLGPLTHIDIQRSQICAQERREPTVVLVTVGVLSCHRLDQNGICLVLSHLEPMSVIHPYLEFIQMYNFSMIGF